MARNSGGRKIRGWYRKKFPADDLGERIDRSVTFDDLWSALCWGRDVYGLLGVGDSLVRERCFDELSRIMRVDYDVIYRRWLYPERSSLLCFD